METQVGAYGGELSHMLQQFVGETSMILIDPSIPEQSVDDYYQNSERFTR